MIFLNLGARIAAAVMSVPPDSIAFHLAMMAPLPSSHAEFKKRAEVDSVLVKLWQDADGFDATPSEKSLVDDEPPLDPYKVQPKPSTYGEITSLGARQLFHHMGLLNTMSKTYDVVFVDLGSGAGKLVVQAYLELERLRRAVGIEAVPSRHDAAVRAREKLVKTREVALANGSLELVQGDLFEMDLSDATHVYAASLCFTDDMMDRLTQKLATEAPRLRCAATLKAFPEETLGKPSFSEFLEMSWTKPFGHGCQVYFYNYRRDSTE